MNTPLDFIAEARRLTVIFGLLLAVGCQTGDEISSRGPAGGEPPAPEVEAVAAEVQQVREFREYTGRTAAANSVQIRARVSGYLLQSPQSQVSSVQAAGANYSTENREVTVSEGELVKKGTLLFQVDPEPYQLALDQTKGSLATALAQLKRFELELNRTKELFQSNSISRADYDQAVANRSETLGQIENLEAAVKRAELDLNYTRVEAPIDGLLGRSLVTPGNLISADSTLLTTIVSAAPIYVYFDVDERSLLEYRERIRQGEVPSARQNHIPAQLGLANDKDFPHEGVIDFVDNQTDASTGNTRLRATFPNTDGALSAGLFARIRVPFSSDYRAVLIPTKAIGTDQQGKFVMIVQDGKADRRSIMTGPVRGAKTVIKEGLKGDETVIVSGLQKVRPGAPVRVAATPSMPAGAPTPAAAPANPATEETASASQTGPVEPTSKSDPQPESGAGR